jgi:hypothetical protein
MKTKIITSLVFLCCSILIACTSNKQDRIFCGGDCPGNKVCIKGKCTCPENTVKTVGDYCYPGTKKDSTGFPIRPIYFVDTSSHCFLSEYIIGFPFFGKTKDTSHFSGGIIIGDEYAYLITPGQNPNPQKVISMAILLRPDGHYHFYFVSDYKYDCPQGGQAEKGAEGIFSLNFDTLRIKNYSYCPNSDTCYETRLLLK